MSLFESASLVVTPNGTKASKLYSIKPTDGSGDLSVTRATTATRVNSSGLIETVSANVPRLDYSNGSCPSILVEPQRTNLLLRSEEFDNASWSKIRATINYNSILSPYGNISADKVIATSETNSHYVSQSVGSLTISTAYSISVFAKKEEQSILAISSYGSAYSNVVSRVFFNIENGTIGTIGSGITAKIEDYGNGWYRCIATRTSSNSGTITFELNVCENSNSIVFTGNNINGLYLWGAQLEAGSNATSYIPTTSATVTRNADVISKTGISSLIGQIEGTMFTDVNVKNLGIPTRQIFNLTNGTPNFVNLSFLNTNVLRVTIRANAGTQYNVSTSALPIGRYKLAATYKAGELKLYVNGVLIGTNTNASVSWSSALDRLNLDNSVLGGENFSDSINLVSHWKTVLTNEECINLTTI